MEDNNYRFLFEYFIDYSDKRSLLLKEMTTSLLMSTSSILIVVIIFMITYRNLMEEKRLSDLKTDFINNMTHELKTPLSTITVAGRTLEMPQIRTNEDKILETARMIGKQSVHLNQIINMILEISMWERTQFQLDKKVIDIEEVMNDIVDSFKSGSGDCVSISRKYSFNGAKADLDVVYFTTLINNLLSNAVKYSNRDPVIDIEGTTTNEHIRIKVSDNGIGIDTVLKYNSLELTSGKSKEKLTLKEAQLLKYLIINKNKVLAREDILTEIWGEDDYFLGRSMDVFISRLRKYISEDKNIDIRTVRGMGFILEEVDLEGNQ